MSHATLNDIQVNEVIVHYNNPIVLDNAIAITNIISIEDNECPYGGDTENDCADCISAGEYHCVNGECVLRVM